MLKTNDPIHHFIDNKYTRWYFAIIKKASNESRKKSACKYYESHHIIPKCDPFFGSDIKSNKVLLTAKEHFICHFLLTKMCEGIKKHKMIWALHRMSFSAPSENRKLKSIQYETARKLFSKHMSENNPNKNLEARNRISERVTKDWEFNETRKKEVAKIFSSSHEKRKLLNPNSYYETQKNNSKKGSMMMKKKWEEDEEWANSQKEKMSNRMTGKNNHMYGKKIEGEHREKLSKATARKRWMHNNYETVYVDKDLVQKYIDCGYKPGRNNYKRKETR